MPTPHSRLFWHDTELNELICFVAFVIMMGIVKKSNISNYWSMDPLLLTLIFGKVRSQNRLQYILSCLNFFDTLDPVYRDSTDKLRRIRLISDHLRHTYFQPFHPYKNLVTDKSLVLWRVNYPTNSISPVNVTDSGARSLQCVTVRLGTYRELCCTWESKQRLILTGKWGCQGQL